MQLIVLPAQGSIDTRLLALRANDGVLQSTGCGRLRKKRACSRRKAPVSASILLDGRGHAAQALQLVKARLVAREQLTPRGRSQRPGILIVPDPQFISADFDFQFCVHLCSLAQPYGAALEAGELKIEVSGNELRVRHYENTWPLGPASWGELLASDEPCFDELERLGSVTAPVEEDRCAYRRLAARARALLA